MLENPDEDVAFLVNIVKTGITNDDLGTNITTMTVSKAWFDQRQSEDKEIFIAKLDEEGNAFTLPATCTPVGDVVECSAEFTDSAPMWFFNGKITGGPCGPLFVHKELTDAEVQGMYAYCRTLLELPSL